MELAGQNGSAASSGYRQYRQYNRYCIQNGRVASWHTARHGLRGLTPWYDHRTARANLWSYNRLERGLARRQPAARTVPGRLRTVTSLNYSCSCLCQEFLAGKWRKTLYLCPALTLPRLLLLLHVLLLYPRYVSNFYVSYTSNILSISLLHAIFSDI